MRRIMRAYLQDWVFLNTTKSMRRQLNLVAQPTPLVRLAELGSQKAEDQLYQHDRVSDDTAKLGSSADASCASCLAWEQKAEEQFKTLPKLQLITLIYTQLRSREGELYSAALQKAKPSAQNKLTPQHTLNTIYVSFRLSGFVSNLCYRFCVHNDLVQNMLRV